VNKKEQYNVLICIVARGIQIKKLNTVHIAHITEFEYGYTKQQNKEIKKSDIYIFFTKQNFKIKWVREYVQNVALRVLSILK